MHADEREWVEGPPSQADDSNYKQYSTIVLYRDTVEGRQVVARLPVPGATAPPGEDLWVDLGGSSEAAYYEHVRQLFGGDNGGPAAYCHLMAQKAQDAYLDAATRYGTDSEEANEQLRVGARWLGALEQERAVLIGQEVARVLREQ